MKKNIIIASLALFTALSHPLLANDKNYQLSSHILDITQGQPAPGVGISLYMQDEEGNWILAETKTTDKNGRVGSFLEYRNDSPNRGIYKLKFETKPYFQKQSQETFYPFIEVVFEIADEKHYHIPITLTPFGYSTYRGN